MVGDLKAKTVDKTPEFRKCDQPYLKVSMILRAIDAFCDRGMPLAELTTDISNIYGC